MRSGGLFLPALALAFAVGGCGGGQGVAENATVSVYAAAGLCAEAKDALAGEGERAGSLRIRLICLPDVRRGKRLDLAAVGANARRAREDSTTVGYIGEVDSAATRFSETILEEADIAQLSNMPGDRAMRELLSAIEHAGKGSPSLREEVRDQLER